MRRAQLIDLLSALGRVSGETDVVLVGSQCIHAISENPPAEVLMSAECDVLVADGPLADLIDRELGPTSPYQSTHGVYVDTVPAGFPFLPPGYETRLRALDAGTLRARCLEAHDLALSKLAAGRLKDYETVAALLDAGTLTPDALVDRIGAVAEPRMRAVLLARLQIVRESQP